MFYTTTFVLKLFFQKTLLFSMEVLGSILRDLSPPLGIRERFGRCHHFLMYNYSAMRVYSDRNHRSPCPEMTCRYERSEISRRVMEDRLLVYRHLYIYLLDMVRWLLEYEWLVTNWDKGLMQWRPLYTPKVTPWLHHGCTMVTMALWPLVMPYCIGSLTGRLPVCVYYVCTSVYALVYA